MPADEPFDDHRFSTQVLERALAQLQDALVVAREEMEKPDSRYRLHLRSGAIQAFEYTYELCEKTLRRFLKLSESSQERIDELSFADLFRLGFKRGLVKSELRDWYGFRAARNRTSHTYREFDAQAVFEGIPHFLEDAKFLLAALDKARLRL